MNPADILSRFRDMTLRQQLTYAAVIIVPIIVAGMLLFWATRTTYTTLSSGMDPADSGKVVLALEKAGIPAKLSNGGSQVEVPSGQLDQARVAMATSGGGATGKHSGFEMFDNTKLGATDFQQKVQYQRALEGEIARTVEGIEGVSAAQVQLVLPKDQLFTEEGTAASASVMLTTDGSLDSGSVRGISKLVQSGVEGLEDKNITITDQTGKLLWPSGPGETGGTDAATVKQAAEASYANQVSGKLNALLTQALGPGKASAQVSADLNVDKASEEQLDYSGKPIPLREKVKDEQLRGAGAGGGTAGTDSNIPTYATGGSGSGDTRYDNKETDRDLGVDKKVTRREIAPGAVQRLSVAVLIDSSVPQADVTAVQRTLASAAGLDTQRGDRLDVARVKFSSAAQPPAAAPPITNYVKYGLLAFGLLVFAFFVWRGLRRRDREELGDAPVFVRDLVEPPPPPAPKPPQPQTPEPVSRQKSLVHTQVEGLVDEDPEQIAQHVKQWLNYE